MCGIIGIVRRPDAVVPVDGAALVERLKAAAGSVLDGVDGVALGAAAEEVASVDGALRPLSGVAALVRSAALQRSVEQICGQLDGVVVRVERSVAAGEVPVESVETVNAGLLALKDAVWCLGKDRLRTAREVSRFAGSNLNDASIATYLSIQQALSALDRLEVRGRDSAGLEVAVHGHGLDLSVAPWAAMTAERSNELFTAGAVRVTPDGVSFVYKAAAEIGELGDNTAELRKQISADALLAHVLTSSTAWSMVLGHTRWASIGVISEPNAHPQASDEAGVDGPFATAVLNGDVDNHADLSAAERLQLPLDITTDAKVIPVMLSRRVGAGAAPAAAFRETVSEMEGSVAIAAHVAAQHDRLLLALRGSGQALYVGLGADVFVVASEPYGLVEEADRYLRLDGETPSNPANPTASRGQIVELRADHAGELDGVTRWSYDGTELPFAEADVVRAEITTRDIDRGQFPHFLLKELGDAPGSFEKTLRGKLISGADGISVLLPASTIPDSVTEALRAGDISRVLVIGQGTAAIAGESLAFLLSDLLASTDVSVLAQPATELSGFHLRSDMSDTLVIAISQSGTTTDTNRTVDIVRGRGAKVIAIVNRRRSDLVDKSDGTLYTADGRDVEMSVASTKAFYSQIAAGLLLACAIADRVPGARTTAEPEQQALLSALASLPDLLRQTLNVRPQAAEAAQRFALSRRYWAIVGNGPNRISAREVRIKLSELCYRSIACDSTEDKKHIDLSCEPMVLVCAAGLVGSTADDVSKEVAIFRAHKAAPIVVATEGAGGFEAAAHVIRVPETHPQLAFILSAMVGHLFGYEAALAIDAQARPLREARGAIDGVHPTRGVDPRVGIRPELDRSATAFYAALRTGDLDGNLEASTATKVAALFRYALDTTPLDAYQIEFGRVGTPGVVLDDLSSALSGAIDELTRPIDAIKHQAKTVTVGISRSDESVLEVPLVKALMDSGASRDRLSFRTLRSLADLDPAVVEVLGYIRYGVTDPNAPQPTATIVDRGGIATKLRSRVEADSRLRGTKHLVAREQELMVTRGRSDSRTVVIVPQIKDGQTTGLVLLHVRLADHLDPETARGVMQGYRRRYQALSDAVTETEDHFRDDLLSAQPVEDLLVMPILDLAERWRTSS